MASYMRKLETLFGVEVGFRKIPVPLAMMVMVAAQLVFAGTFPETAWLPMGHAAIFMLSAFILWRGVRGAAFFAFVRCVGGGLAAAGVLVVVLKGAVFFWQGVVAVFSSLMLFAVFWGGQKALEWRRNIILAIFFIVGFGVFYVSYAGYWVSSQYIAIFQCLFVFAVFAFLPVKFSCGFMGFSFAGFVVALFFILSNFLVWLDGGGGFMGAGVRDGF